MYSEGDFGSGSEPSANLIAISHVPATDRYNSDDEAVGTSRATALSLSSAATPQRNTLVSSRYFMPSSWLFSRPFSFVLRIDQANPRARARQNPLGRSVARKNPQDPRRLLLRHGNQAGHRNPAVGDGNFLAGGHPAQQPRKLRFRFVRVHFFHAIMLD